MFFFFFFQAEDGIRDVAVTGVQTCALPIYPMILRGIPGLRTPMPMIPGADVAGEIVELGSEVDRARWKVGDRAAVIPNRKPSGMMGETLRGGACELIAISPEWLLPLPDKVTYVQAACLPTAYGA